MYILLLASSAFDKIDDIAGLAGGCIAHTNVSSKLFAELCLKMSQNKPENTLICQDPSSSSMRYCWVSQTCNCDRTTHSSYTSTPSSCPKWIKVKLHGTIYVT